MSHGPRPDLTISIERPGSRRMRGLDGPGDRRGHGRHRERGDHPRPGPGRLQSRRGAIRDATLALLAEQPMHGYQVMQELAERSGGRWHPSAGSVYPTLQQLEDEGLIEPAESESGRRVFALTEAGREANTSEGTSAPWEAVGDVDTDLVELRDLVHQVLAATRQVAQAGTAAQVKSAQDILRTARKGIYRLLAEDE